MQVRNILIGSNIAYGHANSIKPFQNCLPHIMIANCITSSTIQPAGSHSSGRRPK